jgi:hypothetical protein
VGKILITLPGTENIQVALTQQFTLLTQPNGRRYTPRMIKRVSFCPPKDHNQFCGKQ